MKKLLISLTAIALSLLVFTACTPKEEEKPECPHTNTEIIPATEPTTCGEYAYRAGKKCLDCGEIIVAPVKYGDMKEHIEKNFSGVPVSCTKDGKTPSVECSFCGEVLVPAETIKALGHTYVDAPTIEATCTEAGYTGGKVCKLCGEYDPENPPTMTSAALGHNYVVDKEAQAATCQTAGWTAEQHCSRCTWTAESVEIPVDANKHPADKVVTLKAVEASCKGDGTTGLTEGKKCDACGVTFVAQEVVPVPEHTYGEEPTTTEGCEKTYTCTVDGCGATKTVTEHTWDEGNVTTEPTETTEGEKTYTCTVDGCGATKMESIPATGTSNDGEGTLDGDATT